MLLLLNLFLIFLISLFAYYKSATKKIMEFSEKIPGPKALPILGNILDIGVTPKYHFIRCEQHVKKYGSVLRLWLGTRLVVGLMEPNSVEALLSSQKVLGKAYLYKFIKPWLGLGLLTSTGQRWRSHRKLLTPAFHFHILREFVEVFANNGDILVEQLSKHVNGPEFDVCPYIALCALDNISESAMGVAMNAQRDSNSDYVRAVRGLIDVVFKRATRPWIHPDFTFRFSSEGRFHKKCLSVLHHTTNSVIKTRRQELLKEAKSKTNGTKFDDFDISIIGMKRRLAFLDLLIQASETGVTLTDEEIREEVDTFMFEGHDTTTSAICFCLWSLSKHQDIQDKAFEEMKRIFGTSDRPENYQDLQDMRYLEMVVKESLRLYPSVLVYGRNIEENIKLGEYVLPAGCDVWVVPYFLQRNPDYFPDPEKFDPERFSPENSVGRHPFCYVPFAAGPRNCIGQRFAMLEIKSTISKILRNYKLIESDSKEELNIIADLMLKTSNGLKLKLQPRMTQV